MSGIGGKIRLICFIFVFLAAQWTDVLPNAVHVAEAADNGLARKPFMGWTTYDMQVYSGNGQWDTEDQIKAQSDAMHRKLQAYGYKYINIDAGWSGGLDEYGRPYPNEALFPSGFQNLIDYIHNNGQKVGVYMIPGLAQEAYNGNWPIYGAPGCHMQDIAVSDMDIYVDGKFYRTVSAYHSVKVTQQTLFSISGLTDRPHTLKVVKKSGTWMILDELVYRTGYRGNAGS